MNSKSLGVAFATLLLAATACSKSAGRVSVSAATAATTPSTSSGTLDLGNGIVISRVRIAVQKIALEGAVANPATPDGGTPGSDDPPGHTLVADHGSGSGSDDGSDDDANEVKVGPFLVDLTGDQLTSGLKQVFDGEVPAGTYREIKVVVGVVPVAQAGSITGLADMNGQSVIVDGTFNGTAFSFQSTLHAAQKQESSITVASDGSTSNVTLSVDPTGWFTGSSGALDPSAAASKAQIEDNIRRSLKAFCDHDRNGEDDAHQGDGAKDGAGHA